jgi:catechol 2,3-dioxygenase-like lactoylglutathione lyase family enzyme
MESTANWSVAPILGVTDVRRSVDYFRSVLGFQCDADHVYASVSNQVAFYAILRREGVLVHLQVRATPLHRQRLSAGAVLFMLQSHEGDVYFYVRDVDALYAEYRQKNVKIYRPLQDQSYGVRDFVIETPDGHRLAFGTPMRR